MHAQPVLPLRIETERLILRPWSEDDAPALRSLWAERDPRARRRITPDGRPTVDELREQIHDAVTAQERTGLALLVVEQRSTPGFAGYCGLVVGQATEAEPELAYELLRRIHGHGIATEAARALVAAADVAGWTRLWATIRDWNAPSRSVAGKVGFRESGRIDRDAERGDSLWYVRDAGPR
ncbi:GNAT family N-acetyltransferase [Amnibacterium kyonggiense]|uniref:RimJ/RimL family protein N-acetyltransferase n=1 Tax=Amnibacterium kyonggiense TaxID=595671 RepID=A0A4R7FSX7_9MICO|nr:GNAT family N-acetyltransferase [Amnibacterium kyonggiense]TDS80878.1 RimJ/RimL family protein N-acetyltransferase [Amnibacterium kyonggiense]